MSKLWRQILAAIALVQVLPSGSALAENTQALEEIATAAVEASRQRALQQDYDNVAVEVRPLDNRLRLPRCGEPLTSFIPRASQVLGAVSVGVECPGPQPWTIYVRTQVVAQRAVPVLVRPVARNTVITEQDVKMIDQPVESTGEGIVFDPQQIVGMELTRSLSEGSTIRLRYLRPPKVVKRGQQVTLIAAQDGLEVRMAGQALTDAAAGDRVRVSAETSGKTVDGTAHSDGTVHVQ